MQASSFPRDFQRWWGAQKAFAHKSALAAAIGTNRVSVRFWFAGRAFPRDEYCERLHEITGLDCFGPGRDAARDEHEHSIPSAVKKTRRSKYQANVELFRKRALASWRKRYERERQFVTAEELAACRTDPRKAKTVRGDNLIVCLECGEILRDLSFHVRRVHRIIAADYKAKWGYNRGTALRSVASNEKMAASMKRSGHRPPKSTRRRLEAARASSLCTNRPGTARLEERLNAKGKRLAARPRHWKRTRDGDVVTDARIAQMRLAGHNMPQIAATLGMTLAPVYYRLKRMGFPKRARVFVGGEAVGWSHVRALSSDFGPQVVAERLGVSKDWLRRPLKRRRKGEALSPKLARNFLRVRAELLAAFRRRPAGPHGGRPRQLPASERAELPGKYDALRADLKALRRWLRDQEPPPPASAIWGWLCERFRAGQLRSLQFRPKFFAWTERNYTREDFRSGLWVPHDCAVQFLADEYGASEAIVEHTVKHAPKNLHQNGAITPPLAKA